MYPDHRSISEETVSFTVKADLYLMNLFRDSTQAESKYLDQTMLVSGVITVNRFAKVLQLVIKFMVNLRLLNSDLKVNDSVLSKAVVSDLMIY